MSGLAAFGSLVGGGVNGYRQSQYDRRADEDQRYQEEQRGWQREERARDVAKRTKTDNADKAFATYLDQQRAEWAQRTGQPLEAYRPDLTAQVGALDARGTQLAADGNWKDLLTQRATAAPIYTAARNGAIDRGLAQYEADKDPVKLAQTVYPHIRDGRKISMAKTGPDGSVMFNMDDGSSESVKPDQLVATLKRLRMDPELAAKMDVEHLKARIEADKDKRKLGHDLTVEEAKAKSARGLADLNNDRAVQVANIGASASRYSADKGAESREKAATISAGKTKPGDEVKDGENLLDTLAKAGFGGNKDLLTGRVMPDALTQQAAQRVNQYRKSGGLSFDEAVAKVRDEMKARGLGQ